MISLEKNEIARYLKDYAILSELIRNYPDIKIGIIYRNYMISNGRIDEYQNNSFIKMIRVYGLMTELRMFSIKEDLSIKYLNEAELDFDDIKSKIFVNPNDAKRFSKKQIITYIRNAVNHSDAYKTLYNISVNGRFMEINLHDTNPIPFHIKLNYDQISKIHDELFKKSHNLLMGSIDYDAFDFNHPFEIQNFDNLEFVYFYFPKKIISDAVKYLYDTDFSLYKTCKEKFEKASEILINHECTNFRIIRVPITNSQKQKMISLLQNLKNLDLTKIDEKVLKISIEHILNDTIPLGMYHTDQLYYEQQFAAWFMSDENLTYNEILSKMKAASAQMPIMRNSSNDYKAFDDVRYQALRNYMEKHVIQYIMMTKDYNSRVMYPISMFLGYISDSLFEEKTIEIAGQTYVAEKIRNSFVHGRWYFGTDESIELYDEDATEDDKSGDMFADFKWHKSINIRQLLLAMNDLYEQKEINKKARK